MADSPGVLLANLGTPDAPTTAAVRRFLAEFLSDRRVVDLPRLLWLPVLHGAILPFRPRRSAEAYRAIWTPRGSPLLVNTLSLARALETRLGAIARRPVPVEAGMTYGRPDIPGALGALAARGVARVLVLPLYPQFSTTTTLPVFDRVEAAVAAMQPRPEWLRVEDYHDDAGHVGAVAGSLSSRLPAISAGAHLLFSFHGLPRSTVEAGDPYESQCVATAQRVAGRLSLPAGAWSLSFQSRVGRARWLEPYTEDRLRALPAEGRRRIVVCCPGFAVDCLETLEEIAIRGRELFLASGGERFDYVPALNDGAAQVESLAQLAMRALGAGQAA